ncbi:uncharacterized protein LOC18433671 isoform X2 [Amborella trichopoda]|uniref:uncharacterized protein LOC18433671 isoform X2 n=1 Tax=Amborella trichopoda TaxID=13333 RepID=UPI0009BF59BC|nr:uncharacterized protein LOC18433671 isoform X2 [Amborella trichopoda]|eukprot:XP_020522588.1 uncharacterized protein LOC18433671 isoform X2 [Amborella trichopoda]
MVCPRNLPVHQSVQNRPPVYQLYTRRRTVPPIKMAVQDTVPHSPKAVLSFVSGHLQQKPSEIKNNWPQEVDLQHCGLEHQERLTNSQGISVLIQDKNNSSKGIQLSNFSLCPYEDKGDNHVYKRRNGRNSSTCQSTQVEKGSTKKEMQCYGPNSVQLNMIDYKDDPQVLSSRCSIGEDGALSTCQDVTTEDCEKPHEEKSFGKTYERKRYGFRSKCSWFGNKIKSREVASKSDAFYLDGESGGIVEASCNVISISSSNADSCLSANHSSSFPNFEECSKCINPEVSEAGECSSSGNKTNKSSGKCDPEKQRIISILQMHGLLGQLWSEESSISPDDVGDNTCMQQCKVCGVTEKSSKLLICDECEEAFHMLCCNPRVNRIPVEVWFCQQCKRQRKRSLGRKLRSSSPSSSDEMLFEMKDVPVRRPNPLTFMFKDTEPYTTQVRIGEEFQAEVPEWSGPISADPDNPFMGTPLESAHLDCLIDKRGKNGHSIVTASVGNWLQCRATSCDGDAMSCGKWRRAPLYETQTDDWDCSCAVRWDPTHADCAVPQELSTNEVLGHLKYIEVDLDTQDRTIERQGPSHVRQLEIQLKSRITSRKRKSDG